jgi:hypothetical protein
MTPVTAPAFWPTEAGHANMAKARLAATNRSQFDQSKMGPIRSLSRPEFLLLRTRSFLIGN